MNPLRSARETEGPECSCDGGGWIVTLDRAAADHLGGDARLLDQPPAVPGPGRDARRSGPPRDVVENPGTLGPQVRLSPIPRSVTPAARVDGQMAVLGENDEVVDRLFAAPLVRPVMNVEATVAAAGLASKTRARRSAVQRRSAIPASGVSPRTHRPQGFLPRVPRSHAGQVLRQFLRLVVRGFGDAEVGDRGEAKVDLPCPAGRCFAALPAVVEECVPLFGN